MTKTPRKGRVRSTTPPTAQHSVVPFPEALASARTGVRWSRVMNAQSRIAAGYYERPEVTEQLLDALAEELARH